MRKVFGLFFTFVALANAFGQAKQPLPTIAYSSGSTVVIIAGSGKPIKTFKLPAPAGEFSVAPDQRTIAVVSPHDKKYGGKMSLFTVATGKLVPIPSQAIDKDAGADEVYSEPQFSPDGKKLLFVTHSQAEGDIIDGAGPLAILDLRTLQSKPLQPTLHIDVGSDFLSHPRWDPAGHQVLLNIENTLAIVDLTTNLIRRLDRDVVQNFLDRAVGIGWIGNNCVLYETSSARTSNDATYSVLNMKTGKHFPAEKLLGLDKEKLHGFVSFSFPFVVVKKDDRFTLLANDKTGPLNLPASAVIQLIPPAEAATIPEECK